MRVKKQKAVRLASFLLALVMALTILPPVCDVLRPQTAQAASTYTINGVTIPLPGFEVGKNVYSQYNCWEFAQMVYKKLWNNQSFTNKQNTSDNMLKDVEVTDAARHGTAANLKKYISQATLGSVLRISRTLSYVNGSDGDAGHSMIIVARDGSQFTVYDSTSSGIRLATYTYENYANALLSGNLKVKDAYIKYIKSPVSATKTFTKIEAYDVTNNDAMIKGTFPATTYLKTCGFYIGVDQNNLQKCDKSLSGKTDGPANCNYIFYRISEWYGKLTSGTKYYYKLYYIDANGTEKQSDVGSFTTGGSPSAPTSAKLTIANNRIRVGEEVKLAVTSPGATMYSYWIYNDEISSAVGVTCPWAEDNTLMEEPGLYYADVYAENSSGGIWSNKVYFQVIPEDPKPVAYDVYNGHQYTFFLADITWTEANEWCEAAGAHLMTVNSAEEQYVLESLLGEHSNGCYWLGAQGTPGNFEWVTGEEWDYENWKSGEPNNNLGVEYYLGTYKSALWNDFAVDSKSICGFVMEFEPQDICEHDWNGSAVVIQEPTCLEAGITRVTCVECGESFYFDTPDALGHDWSDWTRVGAMEERMCRRCGMTEQRNAGPEVTTDAVLRVSTATGAPGREVKVQITAENNPGVVGMMLSVSYSSALTLVKVEDGGLLGIAMHAENYSHNPYQLTWANDTAIRNYTDDGVIATLTFLIAEEAAADDCLISLDYNYQNLDIVNLEMEPVAFQTVSGSVKIIGSMPGDVNRDNVVNTLDRMILARYLAQWDGYEEQILDWNAADIDGNGTVNTLDRMILARYLAHWDGFDSYFV